MTSFPWLTVLWVVPLAGAVLVAAIPARRAAPAPPNDSARQPRTRQAQVVGLVTALVVLGLSIALTAGYHPHGARYQFVESHSWISAFGARYAVGVDGIALALVLLTTALVPLLLLASWNDHPRKAGTYVALTLTVESMVLVSLIALDVLLFYVVFEAMLIPMYFMIGGFGTGAGRSRAAVKFLLYNLFGGLIMLAAVIGLYVVTTRHGAGTFDFREIAAAAAAGKLGADGGVLKALFLGFMFAFAVKAPLWPLHTWLPDAAVQATPATGVLMMAVVDKVGTFGMLRYCLLLFPDAAIYFRPAIITLAVIGILYGAILAIAQTDVMRLIAYTSISHFGFIILGIFAMTSQAQTGSALYMVNHGVSTAALFLVAGFLVSRRGTRLIADYGGVQNVAPVLAGAFLIAGLATLSLPGLAPFVSEFLVLIGTYTRFHVAAVAAVGALVLAALYVLWMYQRMMTGPTTEQDRQIRDLRPRELTVAGVLIAVLLVLGVYPKPALDLITPSVSQTLSTIHQPDPTPTAPTPTVAGGGLPR
jgi:NADH-quinone oxidoreductase subunit M